MDTARVERLTKELIGKNIGGWELTEYISSGKSALVFKGRKDGTVGAVKIFDPELVERFGKEIQMRRIKRELELINHNCPNLISIFAGGESQELLFLVMEFLDWPSLDEVISEVPHSEIWKLIGDIAQAAEYLEKKNLVHRDIKPSNIIVNPQFTKIKLLDLGVLRPVGYSDLTDHQSKPFIGTLRYSPPELLFRTENDSVEGWRAVSFYQIGAVLHDVIMNQRLFEPFSEPYARLVEAVKTDIPHVENDTIDPTLIFLSRNCLAKNPQDRLALLTWDSFHIKQVETGKTMRRMQRLKQRRVAAESKMTPDHVAEEKLQRIEQRETSHILGTIESIIRSISVKSDYLPPSKFSVTRNAEEKTGAFITRFEPSVRYVLFSGFSICFKVSVINISEQSISVKCGVIAGEAVSEESFETSRCLTFYTGMFERHMLQKQIENLFHMALDEVQESYPQSHKIKDNIWVELEEL